MDDDFEYFLDTMGPALDRRYVPPSSIARYRGKLPDQLLAYWEEHGWCGYAEGLFWTVDPQEYEPVLEAWIGGTPFMEQDVYHLIARSAFGDLFFFGEKTGASLQVFAADACAIAPTFRPANLNKDVRAFFISLSRESCDFSDSDGMPLFGPALKQLGRLRRDEVYGFVPALALGGSTTLDRLQKVRAVEHLVILAQLAPLDVIVQP